MFKTRKELDAMGFQTQFEYDRWERDTVAKAKLLITGATPPAKAPQLTGYEELQRCWAENALLTPAERATKKRWDGLSIRIIIAWALVFWPLLFGFLYFIS